jgi:hypothetical protein
MIAEKHIFTKRRINQRKLPPPVPFSADETSITILSHGSRNLQYYLTTYARQNIFTKRQIMKYYSKIFISNTFKDWNILKQIEI